MTEIRINSKVIAIISFLFFVVIAGIYLLDVYDKRRKSNEVERIYSIIEKSPYTDRLKDYIIEYDTSNHELFQKIVESLRFIERENRGIGSCKLYIQDKDYYFEFPYRMGRSDGKPYVIKKTLSIKSEEIVTNLIASKENEVEFLKRLNKNTENNIKIYNILISNDSLKSFIITTKYRY